MLRALYLLLFLLTRPAALAQPTGATLVASGLAGPSGVTMDAAGRAWLTESGTGAADGRVVVVTPDGQIHPFATALPSVQGPEGAEGPFGLLLDGTALWVAVGMGNASPEGYLYRFSTAGFTPGDPPRTPADAEVTVDVGTWVRAQGFAETNAYGLALLDGDLYFTDAAANAVFKRAPDGALSLVASIASLPNPTPVGPPFVQPVPTGVVAADGRLYVAAFTGFPFVEGLSRVYEVTPGGAVTVFRDGLTSTVGLARDPRDGALTALQFATFAFDPPPPGFRPATGRALRLDDDRVLADAFTFASAAAYDAGGALYVATLTGDLYRVTSAPVPAAGGPGLAATALAPPAPNPARGPTTLAFTLARAAHVRLSVVDALGREVAVLADGPHAPGHHTATLDGRALAPGVYVARLRTDDGAADARRFTRAR